MNALLAVVLSGLVSGEALRLPSAPDVRPIVALAPRPDGSCNAATFFARAEEAFFKTDHAAQAPLAADDPVLALVLEGMSCRGAEFPYSKTLAMPPTDQRIPASRVYRAATETFVRRGREQLRAGALSAAEAEFRKAIVLGTLLYEEPGITVIQDTISLSILARGAEGMGDVALARRDKATADVCSRFITDARAYLEGASRFVKSLPAPRALLDHSAEQVDTVAAVAALDGPAVRPSLRLEILLSLALAHALLDAPPPAASQALERARHDADPRLRALGEWALRLDPAEARRIALQLAQSPWP